MSEIVLRFRVGVLKELQLLRQREVGLAGAE
jgi:hypothetical protein